jgi:hypothetical protein
MKSLDPLDERDAFGDHGCAFDRAPSRRHRRIMRQ